MLSDIQIIPLSEDNGHGNMRLDEEMVDLSRKSGKPFIRFYTWSPYAISLGYNQKENQFSKQKLLAEGIDLVRRPTGGRAVFHAEELTYCITAPTTGKEQNRAIYRFIHEIIANAFLSFDIKTDFIRSTSDFKSHYKTDFSKSCFTSNARYELTLDNKKIVGSAQRDFSDILLQHGSILLGPKHYDIVEYLAHTDNFEATEHKKLRFKEILKNSSTDIYTSTGTHISPLELSLSVTEEFKKFNQ